MLAESVISAISVALTCEKGARDLVQIVRFDKNIAAPVAECWDPNEVKYQRKALLVERIGRAYRPGVLQGVASNSRDVFPLHTTHSRISLVRAHHIV